MVPSTPKDKLKRWQRVDPTALSYRDPSGTFVDMDPAATVTFKGASWRSAKYTFPKVQRLHLTVKYFGGDYPYPIGASGIFTDDDIRDRASQVVLDMAAPAAGTFAVGSAAPGHTTYATIGSVYGEVLV